MPRILHTADIHLGKSFARFGESVSARLDTELRRILPAIAEVARRKAVDAVVIAGDLFNGNDVGRATRDHAFGALREFAPLPVVVIPGTHDRYDGGSIYRRADWSSLGHVHVFTDPQPSTVVIPPGIAFHARVNTSNRSRVSPLLDLRATADAPFNVAVAHGSYQDAMEVAADDYPITGAEIRASGMHYVALGHWHKWFEVSGKPVPALYSGSPQPIDFGGRGSLAIVDLESGRVDQYAVASLALAEVPFAVVPGLGPAEAADDILRLPEAGADLLQVSLQGATDDPGFVALLSQRLGDARGRALATLLDDAGLALRGAPLKPPPGTVAAEFVRLLDERSGEHDVALLDEAKAEGLWRLLGGDR